jgi:hypothetical protein
MPHRSGEGGDVTAARPFRLRPDAVRRGRRRDDTPQQRADGKWVVLRVPYPTGFYARWMDGRVDDPKAGWKGRGLWATVSTRTPFHMEGGKGTTSKALRFQLRPDPLAR